MGNTHPEKKKRTTRLSCSKRPPLTLSKTHWPLSWAESHFLPEFPVRSKAHEQRFEKVRELCAGTYGRVYLSRERATDQQFAVKVLSKARVLKENAVQQCKEEVSIQALLGWHPFIVPCTEHWQSKKHLFLVTPYLPCGELHSIWKALGPFSEVLVQIIVAELALVIDFLHNMGVIYRDIKMENVLLDNQGHVQLIDFGFARWLGYSSRTTTICGTMQLMAPEILNMQPYGHAVDWWSLGIIAYALLVGHYPVERCSDHIVMQKLVSDFNYDLPSEYSLPARQLVRKLLCKQPQRRLHSLEMLKEEPFFTGLDFTDVYDKRISPMKLLHAEIDHKVKSTWDSSKLDEKRSDT
ncbi:ribosomal protein S6 kinase-related protein-like [Ornithodoros turicata]|uniref:ribosomal protein S6 kinase-related protein-like n=1 Tax=Ornithodoros turicata TaxID=34597 RepID=UPI0031397336